MRMVAENWPCLEVVTVIDSQTHSVITHHRYLGVYVLKTEVVKVRTKAACGCNWIGSSLVRKPYLALAEHSDFCGVFLLTR